MAATALALDTFTALSDQQCDARIRAAKAALGDRLMILGHHYQRDEVFAHADISGDSLKLSAMAAESDAEYIVFCGVHFMAEVADILTRDDQIVILPDLAAGCSMADMADYEDAIHAWDAIHEALAQKDRPHRVIPITYVNSTAAIKAFVGANGGACCTSSNADRVFAWALEGGTIPKAKGFPLFTLPSPLYRTFSRMLSSAWFF